MSDHFYECNELFLTLDIETLGPNINDSIVAFAYVLRTQYGRVLQKKVVCVRHETYVYNPNCYERFWKNKQALMKRIKEEGIPQKQAFEEFHAFLILIETKYTHANLVFVSDNPSFDFTHFDFWFQRETQKGSIRYSSNGKRYRKVIDVIALLNGIDENREFSRMIEKRYPKTHWPLDDAIYISELCSFYFNYKRIVDDYRVRSEQFISIQRSVSVPNSSSSCSLSSNLVDFQTTKGKTTLDSPLSTKIQLKSIKYKRLSDLISSYALE